MVSLPFADLLHFLKAGSISQEADGSLLIQSAPERYLAWILAAVVVVLVSGWCWRHRIGGRYAPGAFFAAFLVPIIVVPGIAMESIRVSPDRLLIRTGLWFSPKIEEIPLAGAVGVTERSEAIQQRVFSREDIFWYIRYSSGEERQIHLSDLLEDNRAEVVEYLRQHGIETQGE